MNHLEDIGTSPEPTEVKCYSGHIYAERPESFVWQNEEHKVSVVEKAWQEPGKKLFKVITDGGKLFELRYIEERGGSPHSVTTSRG